ncbi:uncharacterized protein BT62DRAFT_999181 [Guyanagaster necrorhizus]|uniref:Uncharacterized protein n=1 Tax=Guyanagaster necrorhizus TaxID=856835 RepID=A0A9P7W882_9AGAR|nr:uncharacterized protein BT62DRAFT_999181 [Guyanagaster necrorhizus MCA 3950]KAG7453146.1 hypothetical protein BT62DRAFT_999181 [Guyanagaster necrorhizus MCA 3950]
MPDDSPPPTSEKWISISLVAGTVLTLAIPWTLLSLRKRMRSSALAKAPPRRTGTATFKIQPITEAKPVVSPASGWRLSPKEKDVPVDGAQRALYTVGAFGISTALVGIGALGTVWSAQILLGVDTVDEFSTMMQTFVATKLAPLSSRIHSFHKPELDDGVPADPQWKWDDAEKRLQEIYDKQGGFAWAEAALREAEIEAKLEREKRREMQEKASRQ